ALPYGSGPAPHSRAGGRWENRTRRGRLGPDRRRQPRRSLTTQWHDLGFSGRLGQRPITPPPQHHVPAVLGELLDGVRRQRRADEIVPAALRALVDALLPAHDQALGR